MSNQYITSEISKIMKDKKIPYPLNNAMVAAWIMGHFKGINLKVLDVKHCSSLVDYFILGSATNSTQAQAMAEETKVPLKQYFSNLPEDSNEWALKWDGEWHITYEVFRDLGFAFAGVLILIYILVVGWFQSMITPLMLRQGRFRKALTLTGGLPY